MTPIQRRQQIGRIHAAKGVLGLAERDYRELLVGLTGEDSTKALNDRQINHVLDWLNFLSGRRGQQPMSFDRTKASHKENLVRLCYAVCGIVPAGYTKPPLLSESWQVRMTGRFEAHFEAFNLTELRVLVEGLKSIFRRAGQRDTETLADRRLFGVSGVPSSPSSPIPESAAVEHREAV